MKTSEFIDYLNIHRIDYKRRDDGIEIDGYGVVYFESDYMVTYNTPVVYNSGLDLLEKMIEYTKTPIEEREDVKRYRLVYPERFYGVKKIVGRDGDNFYYDVPALRVREYDHLKFEFTEQEIEAMPFDTAMFTKEEVI